MVILKSSFIEYLIPDVMPLDLCKVFLVSLSAQSLGVGSSRFLPELRVNKPEQTLSIC
jgi:hypothetical protein